MLRKSFIKNELLPGTWCPGCGIGILLKVFDNIMIEKGLNEKNTVIVSGIGCAGRIAGYFNIDTVHTLHGRAVAVAEGIKRANEKLNVVVISGDGDLLSIGIGHLLHTLRREVNLTIFCMNNRVYGMTGGQASPTTEKGLRTLTTRQGAEYLPLDAYNIIKSFHSYFYARTTTSHPEHLKEMIKKALDYEKFSFVEIITPCFTNLGARNQFTNFGEMYQKIRQQYKINSKKGELKKDTLGYDFK